MKNLFLTTAALFALTGQSQAYDDSLSQMMGAGYYPEYIKAGDFLEWSDIEQERYIRYALTLAANATYQHDPKKAECLEKWPDKKIKVTFKNVGMRDDEPLQPIIETKEIFERLYYTQDALKTLPADYEVSTFLKIVAGATCGVFNYLSDNSPPVIVAAQHDQ